MKSKSIAISLLLASTVGAAKIRDIFDAYDQESKVEQGKNEDQIDPAALAAEIGGDDIARDVISATGGIADQTFLQLDADLNKGKQRHHSRRAPKHLKHHRHALAVEEDGEEEKEEKKEEEPVLNSAEQNAALAKNLRDYEITPEKQEQEVNLSRKVYKYTDDIWNTHNTYHRTINGGFDDDDTEPEGHFGDTVHDEIAKNLAEGGDSEEDNLVQSNSNVNVDVEPNSKGDIKKMNAHRDYEHTEEYEKEANKNKVFKYTHDIHNTHTVQPRSINNGIDNSEGEPKENFAMVSEAITFNDGPGDRSGSEGDSSYIQTDSQVKLSAIINQVDGPESINDSISYLLAQAEMSDPKEKKAAPKEKKNPPLGSILHKPTITYPDFEYHEEFFIPAVHGVVEDIYNT